MFKISESTIKKTRTVLKGKLKNDNLFYYLVVNVKIYLKVKTCIMFDVSRFLTKNVLGDGIVGIGNKVENYEEVSN